MKVNGQLEVAQAEQLSSDPSLLPTGRLWMNIANTAAGLLKVFDGTTVQTIQYQSKTTLFSQNSGTSCTVDWSKGLYQQVVLTGNAVISFTNPQAGQLHRLVVTQATYNTSGTMYQFKLNMVDQDPRRGPYQPNGALQPSDNAFYTWYYTAGIRAAYVTMPSSIANPTSLPGTAATGIAISPDGKVIQVGQSGSPYSISYPIFDGGAKAYWGLKSIVANTAAVGTMVGLDYSPDGNFLFGVSNTTPYLQGWHLAYPNPNTSTVLGNPVTILAGAGQCIDVHPNANYVAVGHTTTPFMSVYPYSGNGYGTKIANPGSLPAALVTSIAFSPLGDYLAAASQTSPFIQVWPFNSATGAIGTIAANPTSLPAGGPAGSLGRGIAWRPQGDFIAMASTTSAYVYVVGFNRATGAFTSTILTDAPANTAQCVAWSPDGQYLYVGLSATPYLVIYDFSASSLATKLTFDGSNPGQAVNDIVVHPNGELLFLALGASPYVMCYPLATKVRNYLRQ